MVKQQKTIMSYFAKTGNRDQITLAEPCAA
jgi:hypothetical protein